MHCEQVLELFNLVFFEHYEQVIWGRSDHNFCRRSNQVLCGQFTFFVKEYRMVSNVYAVHSSRWWLTVHTCFCCSCYVFSTRKHGCWIALHCIAWKPKTKDCSVPTPASPLWSNRYGYHSRDGFSREITSKAAINITEISSR